MNFFCARRTRLNILAAMLFLLPNLLGFLIFTAWPIILSLYMSFTDWTLKSPVIHWVGLRNYIDLFSNNNFWFYLYNTFYFMLGIPLGIAGSLFLANLLVDKMSFSNNKGRLLLGSFILLVGIFSCGLLFVCGQKDIALVLFLVYVAGAFGVLWGAMTFRTLLYVPSFASGVATIILWKEIFNPYHGMINNLLGKISGYLPQWLSSAENLLGFLPLPEFLNSGGFGLGAREAILIMTFWMVIGGNNMILYIASIANIPESLYEAAEIDGAGSFAKFLYITIPSVAATTFFISIMSVIGGLQGGFQFAKIMTNGGPAGTTTTLAYYIYTVGFEELQFGYASAVSWVMFAIVFSLTLVNWKYGNRRMEM